MMSAILCRLGVHIWRRETAHTRCSSCGKTLEAAAVTEQGAPAGGVDSREPRHSTGELALRLVNAGLRFMKNTSHNSPRLPLGYSLRLGATFDLESVGSNELANSLLKVSRYAMSCVAAGIVEEDGTLRAGSDLGRLSESLTEWLGESLCERFSFLPPSPPLVDGEIVFEGLQASIRLTQAALAELLDNAVDGRALIPSARDLRGAGGSGPLIRGGDWGEVLSLLTTGPLGQDGHAECVTSIGAFNIWPGTLGLALGGRIVKRTYYYRPIQGDSPDQTWLLTAC